MDKEQIKEMAKLERKIESSYPRHVVYDGERWMFPGELLEDLGIESRQKVSKALLREIHSHHIQRITKQVKEAVYGESDENQEKRDENIPA